MAIAPVIIEFLAKGMPQVQQAFKSIQDSAIKADRAQIVSAEKAERAKTEAVSKWSKVRERIQDRSATMAGRLAAKQAKDEANAVKQAENEKYRAHQARIRRTQQAEKELRTWQTKAARDAASAAKKADQEQYQAVKDRIGKTKQAEKDLDAWQRAAHRQRKQEAAEAKRLDNERRRDEDKRTHDAQRTNRARGRVVEAVVGAGARGVMNGLQRSGHMAMGLASTAAQLGGGFSIADSVMQEQNLRKEAAIISARTILSGAGPGSEHGDKVSTDQVLSKAKAVGIAQNIDPAEVLAGVNAISKLTGNVDKALQVIPGVAKIATATGADLGTMSGLAGNIYSANTQISNEDLQKQLRIFTKQSVVGGVEVEDFARHGSRITAAASMYGGNKEKNEATMGALAQIGRQFGSASSASEATLGAQRFSTDVAKKSKTLKDTHGIDVTDGKGNLRDAESIILDMVKATKGDVTKLYGLVGDRGVRPLEGAANIYKNAGGGEKGLEAVKKEFAKYNTGVTEGEIEAANKRVLEEQKFEQSMRELRIAAGEQLLPAFKDMMPALKQLIPALVDAARIGIPAFTQLMQSVADFVKANKGIIDSLAAHPVGTLIAVELTKSFAAAGLPSLLRGLFSGAFKPPAPPGGGAGGGAGGAGFVPAAAAGAAAGLMTYTLVKPGVDAALDGQVSGQRTAGEMSATLKNGSWQSKMATLDQLGRMEAQYGGARGVGELAANSILAGPGAIYSAITGDRNVGAEDLSKTTQAREVLANEELKQLAAALRESVDATRANTAAKSSGGNSGSNGAGRKDSIIER